MEGKVLPLAKKVHFFDLSRWRVPVAKTTPAGYRCSVAYYQTAGAYVSLAQWKKAHAFRIFCLKKVSLTTFALVLRLVRGLIFLWFVLGAKPAVGIVCQPVTS